jgi:hypothetical protein
VNYIARTTLTLKQECIVDARLYSQKTLYK